MDEKKEKLYLLGQLIRLANSDGHINQSEYEFIHQFSKIFGISNEEFEELIESNKKAEVHVPEMEYERITQFYRLVLLSKIDLEMDSEEKNTLIDMGIKLGLSPGAVYRVIKEINKSEDSTIPPQQLIEIFKTYHN